jgi:hypothetical protein
MRSTGGLHTNAEQACRCRITHEGRRKMHPWQAGRSNDGFNVVK